MSTPKKYEDIDFEPPKKVADEAEKGLKLREEFDRGGTDVGVARARDLKNRKSRLKLALPKKTPIIAPKNHKSRGPE